MSGRSLLNPFSSFVFFELTFASMATNRAGMNRNQIMDLLLQAREAALRSERHCNSAVAAANSAVAEAAATHEAANTASSEAFAARRASEVARHSVFSLRDQLLLLAAEEENFDEEIADFELLEPAEEPLIGDNPSEPRQGNAMAALRSERSEPFDPIGDLNRHLAAQAAEQETSAIQAAVELRTLRLRRRTQ
jgi:hypothetical protein